MAAAIRATFATPPAQTAAAPLTIDCAGLKRTALIVERDPLKLAQRPFAVVLDGPKSNGTRVRRRLGLEAIAHSAKPLFLYPDDIRCHWADSAGADAERDVAMLHDLTARLVGQGFVNPRLIFLVGDSTGAAMAIRAVCSGLDQPIAGLATLNATTPADLPEACAPERPFAYIDVNVECLPTARRRVREFASVGPPILLTALPSRNLLHDVSYSLAADALLDIDSWN